MRIVQHAITRKELANEMGIHSRILYRWLKKENIILDKRLISPREKKRILKKFGFRIKLQKL